MENKLIRVQARVAGVTGYINIMRGTWLGNPFPLTRYSRADSLRLYKMYLLWRYTNDTIFKEYINELYTDSLEKEIALGCTCKVKSNIKCHGDILIEFIKSLRIIVCD